VLINTKLQRIVGKDGDLTACGQVAVVEAIPEASPGQVVVKVGGDQSQVAWLHHKLIDDPPQPGSKVVYDERHRFVLNKVSTETKGEELLSDNLPIVRREDVGAPHPIAEQVVNHFRDALERPEWLEQLGSRDRRGYLFVGQTGGGKSYHIKLIATEIHDLVEQHCGQRHGRVFLCDASQFWSPYFGETEQRINSWAQKISKLGSQKIKDKEGNEIAVPLLGVIEECEALFRSRGGDQQASGHLFDRVLALLLQKLESVENAIGVPIVWVCSTNRPDLIDAAAMRRIGMRKAIFGNLNAEAAAMVMATKTARIKNSNKEKITRETVQYLYEVEDRQAIAKVSFSNRTERVLHRRELVTPSILEEAVSYAVDQCISDSRETGRLQNVLAAEVVEFLDKHFNHLAGMLTPHNLPEYCPEWFAEDAVPVTHVKVLR
jgi:SpoVK/Ycf46/Vps4 family AAA+-type ATPase